MKLPPLHLGRGTTLGALTVFPVWIDDKPVRGLDWRPAALNVSERSGSPVVGELVAENVSSRQLVALEGDMVTGGWQDRMLATSVLFDAGETRVLDALCVEHGRWSGRQDHTAKGRRAAYTVRHGNIAAQRRSDRNAQRDVWGRIGRYDRDLGGSPTSALADHLDRAGKNEWRMPRPITGQRGVILGVCGRILGAELFGSPTGLALRWRGLLEAALLDASLAPQLVTPAAAARGFARWIAGIRFEENYNGGLGSQLSAQRGSVIASGIGADDILHVGLLDEAHPTLEVVA